MTLTIQTAEEILPSLSPPVLPARVSAVLKAEFARAKRQASMPRHGLVVSPQGGSGKTTLVQWMAAKMGGRLVSVSGRLDPPTVRRIETELRHGDVLLLDEIHGLVRNCGWLLQLLNGNVPPSDRDGMFSAWGCTTRVSRLPRPLIDRMPVRLDMNYTENEVREVASAIATREGVALSERELRMLVGSTNGNPRKMVSVLRYWSEGASQAISLAGFSPDGLDFPCWETLRWLGEVDRPVGERSLAIEMGLDQDGTLVLLQGALSRRYVERSPQGITITRKGKERLRSGFDHTSTTLGEVCPSEDFNY